MREKHLIPNKTTIASPQSHRGLTTQPFIDRELQLPLYLGNQVINQLIAAHRAANNPDTLLTNPCDSLSSLVSGISSVKKQPIQGKPMFRGLSHELIAEKQSLNMPIQTKLAIGKPNDQYEQQADQVADRIVNQLNEAGSHPSQPDSPILNQDLDEAKAVRMKSTGYYQQESCGIATPNVEAAIEQAQGKGQTLPDNIRLPIEQSFGADFSDVKVHTDTKADVLNHSLQSHAFTSRQDIFFRQGAYNPYSKAGQRLLTHELTHVVQQNGNIVQNHTQGESAAKAESTSVELPTISIQDNIGGNTIQRFPIKTSDGENLRNLDTDNLEEFKRIVEQIKSSNLPVGTLNYIESYIQDNANRGDENAQAALNIVQSGLASLQNPVRKTSAFEEEETFNDTFTAIAEAAKDKSSEEAEQAREKTEEIKDDPNKYYEIGSSFQKQKYFPKQKNYLKAAVQYVRAYEFLSKDDGLDKSKYAYAAAKAFAKGKDVEQAVHWYREFLKLGKSSNSKDIRKAKKYLESKQRQKEAKYPTSPIDAKYRNVNQDSDQLKRAYRELKGEALTQKIKEAKTSGLSLEEQASPDAFYHLFNNLPPKGYIVHLIEIAGKLKKAQKAKEEVDAEIHDANDTEKTKLEGEKEEIEENIEELNYLQDFYVKAIQDMQLGFNTDDLIKEYNIYSNNGGNLSPQTSRMKQILEFKVEYLKTTKDRDPLKLFYRNNQIEQGNPPKFKFPFRSKSQSKGYDTKDLSTNFKGSGYAIFAMSEDGAIYADSHAVSRFHHSSFLAGSEAAASGEIKVTSGKLEEITNKSGHYQQGAQYLFNALEEFHTELKQDLSSVKLDFFALKRRGSGKDHIKWPGGAAGFCDDYKTKPQLFNKQYLDEIQYELDPPKQNDSSPANSLPSTKLGNSQNLDALYSKSPSNDSEKMPQTQILKSIQRNIEEPPRNLHPSLQHIAGEVFINFETKVVAPLLESGVLAQETYETGVKTYLWNKVLNGLREENSILQQNPSQEEIERIENSGRDKTERFLKSEGTFIIETIKSSTSKN